MDSFARVVPHLPSLEVFQITGITNHLAIPPRKSKWVLKKYPLASRRKIKTEHIRAFRIPVWCPVWCPVFGVLCLVSCFWGGKTPQETYGSLSETFRHRTNETGRTKREPYIAFERPRHARLQLRSHLPREGLTASKGSQRESPKKQRRCVCVCVFLS